MILIDRNNASFLKIVTLALFLLLVACEQRTETYRPNIILISIDTLRADHIPTYGYKQETAPHIDRFAKSAVTFDNAYTPASHTLLAHASLLTGVYPETHGVISHDNSLPDDITTVTEILMKNGYLTGAFVNAGYFDPKFKFDRGFSTYDYIANTHEIKINGQIRFGRTAGQTNQAIFDWLKKNSQKPFFMFVHYFDVHSDLTDLPYESPDAFRKQFEIERPKSFKSGNGTFSASRYLQHMNFNNIPYSDADKAYVKSLYNGGIAYTDSEIGKLLDTLRQMGLFDRSIVILISDHGEEFQEHGKVLHEQVFEELVKVPLIISFPTPHSSQENSGIGTSQEQIRQGLYDLHGKRIRTVVGLIDIMPTILDYLDIERPQIVQGKSLVPVLLEGKASNNLTFFRNQLGSQYGVSDGKWKLVTQLDRGRALLFDLKWDSKEVSDISDHHPEQVNRLQEAIKEWYKETREAQPELPEPTKMDKKAIETLKSLGYVTE